MKLDVKVHTTLLKQCLLTAIPMPEGTWIVS